MLRGASVVTLVLFSLLFNFVQAAAGLHLLVLRLEDLDVVWSQVLSLLAVLVQKYKY